MQFTSTGAVRRLGASTALVGALLLSACQSGDSTVAPGGPADAQGSDTSGSVSSTAPADTPQPGSGDDAEDGATGPEAPEADSTEEAQAVKDFYSALARAVNDGDFGSDELRRTSSSERFERNAETMSEYDGQQFPGPIPFTATSVETVDGVASVVGCSVDAGWGQNESGEPVGSWTTSGAKIRLVNEDDRWKVDQISEFGVDCADVPLEKKEW